MQINIKVKFDKKNKHLNWCKKQGAFFLQNNEMKHQLISPDKKQLHSFKQGNQQNNTDEKQLIHTYRQIINNKDIHQSSKPSTLKKRSKSKNSRRSNGNDSGRKTERVRKNMPDLMKISKQKILVNTNIGNILEDQSFRGTLPGLSGKKVIQRFTPMLSEQQKIELINEKVVYYLGLGVGVGQDDINGNYIWKKNQQIGYRYQLLQALGNGAFGEVLKAYDHKNRQNVALKIIKSKKEHMQLALNEINILMKTKEKDIDNEKNILRIKDFIVFKKHICIITEILSISLYELLQNNKFMSIQMHYIRTFAIQILNALSFLRENKIIHSDLKPENILLKNRSKTGIKVIDFGASMFSHQNSFFYIQSRFYRAPEVILGATYDYSIDMWSFGCLLAQLYLGVPLFAGKNEQEQFSLIVQSLGIPSVQFLSNCKNRHCYFTKDMNPKLTKNQNGKIITPKSKPLNQQIYDKMFANYLLKILIIDPKQRLTPLQALLQPWIMSQMPEDIKQQHMKYMTNKLKKQIEDSQKKSNINKKKNINKTNKHRKRNSDLQMKPPIPIITHKRRCSQGFH